MTGQKQDRGRTFGIDMWATIAAYALALLMIVLATQLHAQTFTVLHTFTGGIDGESPLVGLTIDAAGNLYGTASEGGYGKLGACYPGGCGTGFKLRHTSSGWLFTPIYDFQGHSDGANPYGGVTLGRDGTLYGTTELGGSSSCGTVFNLKPPPAACTSALCQWTKTTLYSFQGDDGCAPSGPLTLDQAGNFYGTTLNENGKGYGNVYELSPYHGGWTETVLHAFTLSNGDGIFPGYGGVVFDKAGNLYGMTSGGGDLSCAPGYGCGMVFQLTPSGSGWTESDVYSFENGSDGAYPLGGVIFDSSGNQRSRPLRGMPRRCRSRNCKRRSRSSRSRRASTEKPCRSHTRERTIGRRRRKSFHKDCLLYRRPRRRSPGISRRRCSR